jgi:hypothetical protein
MLVGPRRYSAGLCPKPKKEFQMAYVSLIRVPGDADELLESAYPEMASRMSRLGPKHGLISHVAAKTDEGMLVINLWESKEGSEAMFRDPEIQQARQESPVDPEQVRFEHYDVANFQIPGQ